MIMDKIELDKLKEKIAEHMVVNKEDIMKVAIRNTA